MIRYRYSRAISFVNMDLEMALRHYLTGCGFRLPGEAQKIDRFVEVFCQIFWADNKGSGSSCPFRHQVTLTLTLTLILILNLTLSNLILTLTLLN